MLARLAADLSAHRPHGRAGLRARPRRSRSTGTSATTPRRPRSSTRRSPTGPGRENPAVVAAYDWPDGGTIVDVGGGQGSLLAAVLAHSPQGSGDRLRGAARRRRGGQADRRGGSERPVRGAGGGLLRARAGGGRSLPAQTSAPRPGRRARDYHPAQLSRGHGEARVGSSSSSTSSRRATCPPGAGCSTSRCWCSAPAGGSGSEAEYRALLTAAGLQLVRSIPTACSTSLIEAVPN